VNIASTSLMYCVMCCDPLREVRDHLEQRVQAGVKAGVARWNIIVDPGLGFAKQPTQSVRAC